MRDMIMTAYAWGFGNIGDAAITPGLLALLSEHFPNHTSAVLAEAGHDRVHSYLDRVGPSTLVIANALSRPFETALTEIERECGGELPPPSDACVDLVSDELVPRVVDAAIQSNGDFAAALRRTKLVIYNSGMVLVFGDGTLAGRDFLGYTVRRSLPLLVANHLGIPYGVYAHSFDSFDGAPGQDFFRRLLDGAAFVFCRERDSLRYLDETRIAGHSRMFVPDSTLSFTHRDEAWAKTFMEKHGLSSDRFLVVVPRTWLGDNVVRDAIGEKRSRAHMAKLRECITGWMRGTGSKVVIAVEVEDELPHARRLVYEPLPEDVRRECTMMDHFWLPDQAAALYRQARTVLTMELHSYLLAFAQGTPGVVATFAESGRKISMVSDFGQPDHQLDIDSASANVVLEAVCLASDAGHRHHLRTVLLPQLRAREQEAMDAIARALTHTNTQGRIR